MTVYKNCTHEIFAGFGECARWDGMVERITKYADDNRHMVVEVRLQLDWSHNKQRTMELKMVHTC